MLLVSQKLFETIAQWALTAKVKVASTDAVTWTSVPTDGYTTGERALGTGGLERNKVSLRLIGLWASHNEGVELELGEGEVWNLR